MNSTSHEFKITASQWSCCRLTREVLNDVSDEVQIASTWFFNKLALAKSISKGGCLDSKSICPRSSQESTQKFFRVFVIIMYIDGQRPHKQTKYTHTRYIIQYGPSGQSEKALI